MKDSLYDDQDYKLWGLLHQVKHAIARARGRELSRYGITNTKAAALFVIQAIGHQATPSEISRWLFREPHSVSNLLSRMEKEGLITKANDLDRKNLIRVALTDKGHQLYNQSAKRESIHWIMSSLSDEERRQLLSFLTTLRRRALQKLGIDKIPPFP